MNLVRLCARVLEPLGRESRLAWSLALANLSMAAAQFAEPVLFGRILDVLAGGQAKGAAPVWTDLLSLLAAWVAFGLFTIACGALIAMHASRLAHRRRDAALTGHFEHVLQLPPGFHGAADSGRLMTIMLAGVDSLWFLWLGLFREHLAAFVSLLVLLPLSLLLNWRLALPLIVLCLLSAALTALALRKAASGQSAAERHDGELAERASDALGNVALVQSFSRIDAEVTGLRNEVAKLLGARTPALTWWAICAVVARCSTTLTMLVIFVVGIWLNIRGLASVGEIVTFTALAGMLIARIEQAVGFASRVMLDIPWLTEFFAVADTVPAVRDRPDAIDPGRMRGMVEFANVSMSHDGKSPAVADLNFTALPGEIVALAGPPGAGKSTALALLHRAFDPQSGSVKFDGMDIRGLTLAALRRNIGVVLQETLLFNRSIAENLRLGRPEASDEEIRAAAAHARALDFIEANPEGLEANVGERGRKLSGGERQRISIARALLKNPPILILDEATGALDTTTEMHVLAALDEAMKGRTTIVVARRLSTLRGANRILMFEHGRVVESGTFDELIQRGGAFAALAKAQFAVDHSPDAVGAADAAGFAEAEATDIAPGIVEPPPGRVTEDAAE